MSSSSGISFVGKLKRALVAFAHGLGLKKKF
jgi:hypothetical protein